MEGSVRRSPLVIAAVIVGCAAVLNACGSTAQKKIASRLGEHSIAPNVTPPAATLVSAREIAALPPSSPRRALFSLWSSLQWQAWPDALSYYNAGLVKQIGTVNLVQAWKFNAATYRAAKPHVEAEAVHGRRVTIRYVLSGSNAAPIPSAITWEKINGRWTVYYDSGLDNALRAWAQAEAQQAIGPSTTKLSRRAIAAGRRAGEMQDRYLATQFAGHGP
jgi:hypothetical protein